MLKRRTLLLALLSELSEPIALTRLHPLVALLTVEEDTPSWYFIPTEKGPFSVDLLHDIRAFERNGSVQVEEESIKVDQAAGAKERATLDEQASLLLEKSLGSHAGKSDDALIQAALLAKPFWGIRTERTDEPIERIRGQIREAERGLYTLGYEGLSIDSFINLLIMANVQEVVDVREFAFSRRSEYAKKNLAQELSLASIVYTGMPEVGIPTKARKEILEDKSKEELLDYYESEILPGTSSSAKKIASLVRTHNIALICHEEDPGQCHRSLFAASVIKTFPDIGVVHDLRSQVKAGWLW